MNKPKLLDIGERCNGCGTCAAVCPSGSISLIPDRHGFLYPCIDEQCSGCGLCEKACQALMQNEKDEVSGTYWAKAKEISMLSASSSGGLFGLLAKKVISQDGAVYGAAFSGDHKSVHHTRVDSIDRSDTLMQSKYVQSVISIQVLQSVEADLISDKNVLYSGTACQIAGLKQYLRIRGVKNLSKLLCVDVICHGVPSPALWAEWLSYLSNDRERMVDVNFRDKRTGWVNYSIVYEYENGNEYVKSHFDDWYMKAFLNNASLRPSCFTCKSKRACGSDITLGDYWKVYMQHPDIESKDGVSAVMVNTQKGVSAFFDIASYIQYGESQYDRVLSGNSALAKPSKPYKRYEEFMHDLGRNVSIEQMMHSWPFKTSIIARMRRAAGKAIKRLT